MTDHSLSQLALFQDFSPEQLALLGELFQPCDEPADKLLFEQGAPAEYLYLVIDGEVHIHYKPEDGSALTVARVGVEGVVGWSAALGSPLYTSSAICVTDCSLLCFAVKTCADCMPGILKPGDRCWNASLQ